MMNVRRAADRGQFDHGWLKTQHSFSFGDYYDPEHMGFRALRVINEDVVAPRTGFGEHPHRDMEIITIVLSGGLSHKDSLENGSTIRPGDVQRMSAGTGIFHSEMNPFDEPVHLLQIWLLPEAKGLPASYAQKAVPESLNPGLHLLAAHTVGLAPISLNQDVQLYRLNLHAGGTQQLPIVAGRHAWVQMIAGDIDLNGTALQAGDGVAISDISALNFEAETEAALLIFDLA